MDRADYGQLFTVPDYYQPPDDKDLREDTRYPNMNSRDYRKKRVERTVKVQPFFECMDINSKGLSILATNDIRGRIWNGSIWGYEHIEDLGETKKSCFKLHCESPITKLKFFQEKIFLVAEANGALKLWSTQSEARDARDYCLFMIGGSTEHLGLILDFDLLFPERSKAVTGSSDACLKIWDLGAADLTCISTMRYAHSDSITAISSCASMEETFVSCSRDKSALIWDYRLPRPARVIYDKHENAFSTVYWSNEHEHFGYILLGDDAGFIYAVDPKVPNNFVFKRKVFDRPVRKISCKGRNIAVIGNTNIVNVYGTDFADNLNLLYVNADAKNFVRDVHWSDDNLFYTIGWDSKLMCHSLQASQMSSDKKDEREFNGLGCI